MEFNLLHKHLFSLACLSEFLNFCWNFSKNQNRHSAAGEESHIFFSSQKTENEILHYVQDDKERPNGVILSKAKNLIFLFKSKIKRWDPLAYSLRMSQKVKLARFFKQLSFSAWHVENFFVYYYLDF